MTQTTGSLQRFEIASELDLALRKALGRIKSGDVKRRADVRHMAILYRQGKNVTEISLHLGISKRKVRKHLGRAILGSYSGQDAVRSM